MTKNRANMVLLGPIWANWADERHFTGKCGGSTRGPVGKRAVESGPRLWFVAMGLVKKTLAYG